MIQARNQFTKGFTTLSAIQFQPVRKENLADDIAAQIRVEILKGTWKPGDLLPSERELSLQFAVNRTTVREALSELEYLGLVERRHGEGCRVLDWHETGSFDLLRHMLTRPDRAGRFDLKAIESVCDTAGIIYRGAAGHAAHNITEAELEGLSSLAAEIRSAIGVGDVDRVMMADGRFHRAVFRATRSVALELLSNTFFQIFDTYRPFMRLFMQDEIRKNPSQLADFYSGIVRALRERDLKVLDELVSRTFEQTNPDLWKEITRRAAFRQ